MDKACLFIGVWIAGRASLQVRRAQPLHLRGGRGRGGVSGVPLPQVGLGQRHSVGGAVRARRRAAHAHLGTAVPHHQGPQRMGLQGT